MLGPRHDRLLAMLHDGPVRAPAATAGRVALAADLLHAQLVGGLTFMRPVQEAAELATTVAGMLDGIGLRVPAAEASPA